MKRTLGWIVRRIDTNKGGWLYMGPRAKWTDKQREALRFATRSSATRFATMYTTHGQAVKLVSKYDPTTYDYSVYEEEPGPR